MVVIACGNYQGKIRVGQGQIWDFNIVAGPPSECLSVLRYLSRPRVTLNAQIYGMNEILDRKIVFSTSWFQLIEKTLSGWTAPYYALNAADYVSVLATTAAGRLLLVRQYRPAVEDDTIELPSGHVEQGESPSEAAEENCWKKLDMTPGELILLAKLVPDTGRLGIQFALRATSKS